MFLLFRSNADERLFLVAESSIMELLSTCPSCGGDEVNAGIAARGTWVKITATCSCSMQRTWSSQPWVANRPLGNIVICTGILFSGVNVSKAFRMFEMMKVPTLSKSQFFRMQKDYLFPAINHVSTLGICIRAGVYGKQRGNCPPELAKMGAQNCHLLECCMGRGRKFCRLPPTHQK